MEESSPSETKVGKTGEKKGGSRNKRAENQDFKRVIYENRVICRSLT